jgi:hypothetical protein
MRDLMHRLIATLLAPGHVRVRDYIAWHATRVPVIRRARCWWHDRKGRPGFRASDYR